MKNIIHFYDQARHSVEATAQSQRRVTWTLIKEAMRDTIYKISSMKFKNPVTDGQVRERHFIYIFLKICILVYYWKIRKRLIRVAFLLSPNFR